MGRSKGLNLSQFIIKQGRASCLALRARDMVQITSLRLPGLPKRGVCVVEKTLFLGKAVPGTGLPARGMGNCAPRGLG